MLSFTNRSHCRSHMTIPPSFAVGFCLPWKQLVWTSSQPYHASTAILVTLLFRTVKHVSYNEQLKKEKSQVYLGVIVLLEKERFTRRGYIATLMHVASPGLDCDNAWPQVIIRAIQQPTDAKILLAPNSACVEKRDRSRSHPEDQLGVWVSPWSKKR